MFVLVVLNDDGTVSVNQVFGPYATESEAVTAGRQKFPQAAEQDEYGRYRDDDWVVLFQVCQVEAPE